MAQSSLTWTPAGGSNSLSQLVQYRLKGNVTWVTFSTETALINTKVVTGLLPNEVYEFRIVNNCSVGGPTVSTSAEGVTLTCPVVTLSQTYESVGVSFPNLGGDITSYEIRLFNNSSVLIDTDTISSPFSGTVTTTFTGLAPSSAYSVRVVPISGIYSKTDCATSAITTDAAPTCDAPTGVSAVLS